MALGQVKNGQRVLDDGPQVFAEMEQQVSAIVVSLAVLQAPEGVIVQVAMDSQTE